MSLVQTSILPPISKLLNHPQNLIKTCKQKVLGKKKGEFPAFFSTKSKVTSIVLLRPLLPSIGNTLISHPSLSLSLRQPSSQAFIIQGPPMNLKINKQKNICSWQVKTSTVNSFYSFLKIIKMRKILQN